MTTPAPAAADPAAAPNTPPPADPTAAPAAPAAATDPAAAPAVAPAEEPKRTPWFQTRIDEITREKWNERQAREAAERERDELKARLAAANGGTPAAAPATNGAPSAAPAVTQEQLEALVQQRLKQEKYAEKAQRTYQAGKTEFTDFDATIQNFNMLGGITAHPALLEAALSMPDGHKVLHHLGKNMDAAARVVQLGPVEMAMELLNISGKLKAAPVAPTVSGAAPPVRPVAGGGSVVNGVVGPDANGEFPGATEAERQANFRKYRESQRIKR